MAGPAPKRWLRNWVVFLGCGTVILGCQTYGGGFDPVASPIPRELKKVSLPPYVIEPPDLVQIDALTVVPKPPYRISALDLLNIEVEKTLPQQPISGQFQVEPEGTVRLGKSYGRVNLLGLTLDEAGDAINRHLNVGPNAILRQGRATVTLAQSRFLQLVRGAHLVTPDGTIAFGIYGHVNIAGLTVPQAKDAIETYLSQFILRPDLSVIVTGYNSKVFYVIFDGGNAGHTMARFPITGNETVLDAISEAGGLPAQSSLTHVWVARPTPGDGCDQILPVNMGEIMRRGSTVTNYQLLPGDRVYIKANSLVTLSNGIDRLVNPIERLFGTILLGSGTAQQLRSPTGFFGGGTGFGGF